MRVYFAAVGIDAMGCIDHMKSPNLLFSYYDLTVGPTPFRKQSYKIIVEEIRNENKKKEKTK